MDGIVQVLGSKFCTGGRSIGPLIRGMRSLKSNTQFNNMPKVAFQNWIGAIENSPHQIRVQMLGGVCCGLIQTVGGVCISHSSNPFLSKLSCTKENTFSTEKPYMDIVSE